MTSSKLATLKFFALLFLLPGLAGLVVSAMLSTYYVDTLPRSPQAEQLRTVPRNIHGVIVYQSEEENLRLSVMEWSSVGVFVLGLALGLVYLEEWGSQRVRNASEDEIEGQPAH